MAQLLATIKKSGPPTENTPGAVGQIYVDTKTGLRWECVEAFTQEGYKTKRVIYQWEKRGLDPDFVVGNIGGGSCPVELERIATICENVMLTDVSASYAFVTELTLSNDCLYLLDYKYYYNGSRQPADDICGLAYVINGAVRWGTAQESNSVTLTSTGVTDTWRVEGATSVFSIYQVNREKTVLDPTQYDLMSLEGYDSFAPGADAHAEGRSTLAAGMHAHAEGTSTEALGDHSHAEGFNTIAHGKYQHVQGSYNVEDTEETYIHIVGNGTSGSARSNAHTVDRNGNALFAGGVYVGGTDQSDASKIMPIEFSTTDLTAGTSPLETGKLYVVYKEVT